MWGGFLGKRRHCLPLIPWVKETPLCPWEPQSPGDRQTAQSGEQAGAGSQALTAPGRTRWEGCGGSSGAGARGLLTFPGKASELHNQSCWLLGSD